MNNHPELAHQLRKATLQPKLIDDISRSDDHDARKKVIPRNKVEEIKREKPTEPVRDPHLPGKRIAPLEREMEFTEVEEEQALRYARGIDFRILTNQHWAPVMMWYYIFASFISFVFMLTASCPIPLYRAGNGQMWSIWRDNTKRRWTDIECRHQTQMFQAIAAYTILSCIACLVSLIAGILQVLHKGHYGFTIVSAGFATYFTLVSWAMTVRQYHLKNCPDIRVYSVGVNRLNAGFALTFISFALMLIATVSTTYFLFRYFKIDEQTGHKYKPRAFLACCLLGGCLLISVVGTAFTLWEDFDRISATEHYSIKITLWHIEIIHQELYLSEFWGLGDYYCSQLLSFFRAARAFLIISDIILYACVLCAVAAVYHSRFRFPTILLGTVAWITLLISWAIMVAARYKNFCPNGIPAEVRGVSGIPTGQHVTHNVNYDGFIIMEGLGMVISAWCFLPFILIYLYVRGYDKTHEPFFSLW